MKRHLSRLKLLFKTFVKSQIYYLSKPQIVENARTDVAGSRFGVGTVAFNNDLVIDYQILFLKKYLLDQHEHIVFDNSSNAAESDKIRNTCSQHKTAYIKLPMNPLHATAGSGSHAYALNWAYKNYFKRLRYPVFGFLDHDVFPIRPTRVLERLTTARFWGLKHYRGDLWYLWPGFCFYNLADVYNRNINFNSYKNMDNGGANWKSLYRYHHGNDLQDMEYDCANISELLKTNSQNWRKIMISPVDYERSNPGLLDRDELVEFFGDWMHLFNASNWRGINDKKEIIHDLMKRLISEAAARGES